jgi:hypothetical protein
MKWQFRINSAFVLTTLHEKLSFFLFLEYISAGGIQKPLTFCTHSHDTPAPTWCLPSCAMIFSGCRKTVLSGFVHIANPRSCNFIFIDNTLQHITKCMHHDSAEPRSSSQFWRRTTLSELTWCFGWTKFQ